MKCPKCGYERQATDDAPDWQCPSCQVAYNKVAPISTAPSALEKIGKTNARKGNPPFQSEFEPDEDEIPNTLGLMSQGQKTIIYSIIINFILGAIGRSQIVSGELLAVLYVCVATYAMSGVVKICTSFGKTQNQKIIFMILSFFPLINLAIFFYFSLKATKKLRQAGWAVGLLGAKP